MGDALITRRGGLGGLSESDAILRVTAPTGSTFTVTKNGVTLTPKIWVQGTNNSFDTALFIISSSSFDANAWSVTTSLGVLSASSTIVINSVGEYNVNHLYGYHLFYGGVLETARSGGLSKYKIAGSNGTYDYSISDDILIATVNYTSGSAGLSILYRTTNKISIAGYSTLHMVVEYCKATNNSILPRFGLCSSNPTGEVNTWSLVASRTLSVGSSTVDYTIDVTSTQGSYYLMLGIFAGTGGTSQVKISDWWLET